MLFNSFQFAFFFLAFVFAYYCLPFRLRPVLLVCASYYFYATWDPRYLLLLIISTAVDYSAGLWISQEKEGSRRRKVLWLSILINIGILVMFKYYNFFASSFWHLAGNAGSFPFLLSVTLPPGISFYTFQSMSYTIDVYRGKCPVEKNPLRFAIYVSFFPQLIIGPIERAGNLLPQFYEKHRYGFDKLRIGGILILKGLFKKMVVADKIAIVMLPVFLQPHEVSSFSLWLTSFACAVMIYADFSGYTDIARGCAAILGIRLTENFKQPFFSENLSEFWKRWHITMTSWFQTYTYWPLVNKFAHSKFHLHLISIFVFTLIGLWHGASWNCVLWGFSCGLFIVVGNVTRRKRNKFYHAICTLVSTVSKNRLHFGLLWKIRRLGGIITTTSIFCISTPLFLAGTVSDSLQIYQRMLSGFPTETLGADFNLYQLSLIGIAILFLFLLDFFEMSKGTLILGNIRVTAVRWGTYVIALLVVLMFGEFNQNEFFYFQF